MQLFDFRCRFFWGHIKKEPSPARSQFSHKIFCCNFWDIGASLHFLLQVFDFRYKFKKVDASLQNMVQVGETYYGL